MTLGSRSFLREFLLEFEKSQTKWEKIWTKNKMWNAEILGTGKSRENNDFGLLGRIGCARAQIWYYHFYRGEPWLEIPWKIDVIIEHENNFRKFEYTIFKFEGASAPLTVGIFYPEEEVEDDPAYQASVDNRADQLNPNKPEYKGDEKDDPES